MNSFELNKVLGAILGTCLITLALNIVAGALFAPEKPAKPGYAIAVKAGEGGEKQGGAEWKLVMNAQHDRSLSHAARRPVDRLPHEHRWVRQLLVTRSAIL